MGTVKRDSCELTSQSILQGTTHVLLKQLTTYYQ